MPVGLQIDGTLQAVREADEAGVKDVIVNLPANGDNWKTVISALESRQMHYFVSITNLAPNAETVSVEPESYRMPGLQGTVDISMPLPGVSEAYAVLASQSTNAIRYEGLLTPDHGVFRFKTDRDLPSDHVLVLYPVQNDLRTADFWEQFDSYRDVILQTIRENPFGPGFRGTIDPFGKIPNFMPNQAQFVPTSPYFRLELEAFLEQKYGSFRTASTAWGLSANNAQTIDDLTYFVPMWSESRGFERAWNRKLNITVPVERARSAMWADIRQVMYSSAVRRYKRLVESIRDLTHAPVIQDWNGWGGPYESHDVRMDGVSFSCQSDSIIDFTDAGARPVSSALRSSTPMVVMATGLKLGSTPESLKASDIYTALRREGVRGVFFDATTPEQRTDVGQVAQLAGSDQSDAVAKPKGLFFPEAALNPVAISEITPGTWWLPGPGSGQLLDFGQGVAGYRYNEIGQQSIVLWADQNPIDVSFRLIDPGSTHFLTLDGTEIDARRRRNEVQFTLPSTPIVIKNPVELPVPYESYQVTLSLIDTLITKFSQRVDVTGTARNDVNQIVRAFDRAPGAAFIQSRDLLRKLLVKGAPYAWIEAETSPMTTFSAVETVPGASNDKVLVLDSQISRKDVPQTASYPVNGYDAGEYDMWISGDIPDKAFSSLQILVDNAPHAVNPTKLSFYGQGLGWYHIGKVNLTARENTVKIVVPSGERSKMRFDVLMLSPSPFVPSGSRLPISWLLPAQPPAPRGL